MPLPEDLTPEPLKAAGLKLYEASEIVDLEADDEPPLKVELTRSLTPYEQQTFEDMDDVEVVSNRVIVCALSLADVAREPGTLNQLLAEIEVSAAQQQQATEKRRDDLNRIVSRINAHLNPY